MDEKNNIELRFFVKIRFHKENKYSALAEVYYYKDNMNLDFFMRWMWYFEYRAALLRVQNPHAFIEMTKGSYQYTLPEDSYKNKVHNLLLAAKRNLTKYKNQIDYVKKNWDELFPTEEHPKWTKVQDKLQYYESRVKTLSNEYNKLIQTYENSN